MLIQGKWDADWHPVQRKDNDGRFIRQRSTFRNWITPNGSAGPEGQPALKAEAGRFHLVVAYICPWASRTLAARALKGLEDVVSVSVVNPQLTKQGWRFGGYDADTVPDDLIGAQYMHELYTHSDATFSGRATVPILWDKEQQTIVNNESADIMRILNSGFGELANEQINLFPAELADDFEEFDARLYDRVNNGVYKAGFASSQAAYEEAVEMLFAEMESNDERLSDGRPYLFGDKLTGSDIRLFVTMIRFDAAYFGLFKCNMAPLSAFPHLMRHTKRLYDIEAIRRTVNLDHIKHGYYSVKALNPNGIVPVGPNKLFAE